MSEQVLEFVQNWVDNNIHADGYEPEGKSEAFLMAHRCVTEAETRGISRESIEEEVGDLVEYMARAIERVNDEEVARLSAKDD